MRKKLTRVGKYLLLGVPWILGAVGFFLAGEQAEDALFTALCMYGMEVQDPAPNALVELARWTAPLATASGVLMLFSAARRKAHAVFHYLLGDSVAVYGPAEEQEELLEQLGAKGVGGRENLILARRYILLWDEEKNLAFYTQHQKALAGHSVCLRSQSLRSQESIHPELRIFCPEETAARLFWKRRCLYEASVDCKGQMKVVFLGFGKLGEELLLQGLQNNIFDPAQRIEYHIFGGGRAFSTVYRQLSCIQDPVEFHDEPWYEQRKLLDEAQALVVLEQEGQLALVQDLLLALNRGEIDIFAASVGMELLSGQARLRPFYWEREARKPEHMWGDALFERAKRINLRYAHLYCGVEETEKAKEEEWKKLDAFTRYSNVSAADYHEVQLKMLAAMGYRADAVPAECLELFSHLEHIRWCRYHYLNNWQFGVPENGKTKDPEKRIHTDLIPYEELPEAERAKDLENVRLLLSVRVETAD